MRFPGGGTTIINLSNNSLSTDQLSAEVFKVFFLEITCIGLKESKLSKLSCNIRFFNYLESEISLVSRIKRKITILFKNAI